MRQANEKWPKGMPKYRYYPIRDGQSVWMEDDRPVQLKPGFWACRIKLNEKQITNTPTIKLTKSAWVQLEKKKVKGVGMVYELKEIER